MGGERGGKGWTSIITADIYSLADEDRGQECGSVTVVCVCVCVCLCACMRAWVRMRACVCA